MKKESRAQEKEESGPESGRKKRKRDSIQSNPANNGKDMQKR